MRNLTVFPTLLQNCNAKCLPWTWPSYRSHCSIWVFVLLSDYSLLGSKLERSHQTFSILSSFMIHHLHNSKQSIQSTWIAARSYVLNCLFSCVVNMYQVCGLKIRHVYIIQKFSTASAEVHNHWWHHYDKIPSVTYCECSYFCICRRKLLNLLRLLCMR